MYTIDQFRILDFTYSDYTHQNCGWITTRPINEGECVNWGNPIAEMMFEGMRYYAGQGSATSAFTYGTSATLGDNVLGLPKATWDDPFVTNGACAKPFMLVISDINPSYDSNQLPGVASAFGTGFTGPFLLQTQRLWPLMRKISEKPSAPQKELRATVTSAK